MATLKELWSLLGPDISGLTDEQLVAIAEHEEELKKMALEVHLALVHGIAIEQRYREKKRELEKLSTEELTERATRYHGEQVRMSIEDDDYDPRGSDFSMPKDSEESIVFEIIADRQRAVLLRKPPDQQPTH